METIRLTGRDSRLSLLQLEKVKQKIELAFPAIKVEIIARSSRGDALQDIPLHTVEGTDFFTQDIFDMLSNGEADIAVHSLKDMSSEHFFCSNYFAVIDRDDTRDIAIFHKNTEQKIARGEPVVMGTCSPRREEMAIGFLQKALPQLHTSFKVITKHIRGNVDTRLRKLDAGDYDGIILATAGINRLLANETDAKIIRPLLQDKKLMLLPLIECVPAPCQGAIVAEANPSNENAINVLKAINDEELMQACVQEKKIAAQYGVGCLQRFGVTSIRYGNKETIYASGRDSAGEIFNQWTDLPTLATGGHRFFSTTTFMGRFFEYTYDEAGFTVDEPVVYVANYKAVHAQSIIEVLKSKRVWAAGTKTWYELAKKGIWIEGCADAFGLEFLQKAWQMPLLAIAKSEVAVVTNTHTAEIWREKKWKVYTTYSLSESRSVEIAREVSAADIIFWTSYRQYAQYKNDIKPNVVHSCPYGETAEQLFAAGIDPVVFPNIKAFQQWNETYSRSHSAA
jgi:hydroxymethylbilane synthase